MRSKEPGVAPTPFERVMSGQNSGEVETRDARRRRQPREMIERTARCASSVAQDSTAVVNIASMREAHSRKCPMGFGPRANRTMRWRSGRSEPRANVSHAYTVGPRANAVLILRP